MLMNRLAQPNINVKFNTYIPSSHVGVAI